MRTGRRDYDQSFDQIPEDEPVFVIRGQDVIGWAAVQAWANLAQAAGANPVTVESALQHAHRMKAYANQVRCAIPDIPKPTGR